MDTEVIGNPLIDKNGQLMLDYSIQAGVKKRGLIYTQHNNLLRYNLGLPLSIEAARVFRACLSLVNSSFNYKEKAAAKAKADKQDIEKFEPKSLDQQVSEPGNESAEYEYQNVSLNVTLTRSEVADLTKMRKSRLGSILESISSELSAHHLYVKHSDGSFCRINITSVTAYNAKTGEFSLRFNQDIMPYITDLARNYTSIPLDNVMDLRATETILFYESIMMRHNQAHKPFKLPVKDLLIIFGILRPKNVAIDEAVRHGKRFNPNENVYPDDKDYYVNPDGSFFLDFGQLNRKIKAAVKEIANVTPHKIEFELIKSGRMVTHVEFSVHKKAEIELKAKDIETMSIEELSHSLELKERDRIRLVNIYGEQAVLRSLRHAAKKGASIVNAGGYVRTLLRKRAADLPYFMDCKHEIYAGDKYLSAIIEILFEKIWFQLSPEFRAAARIFMAEYETHEEKIGFVKSLLDYEGSIYQYLIANTKPRFARKICQDYTVEAFYKDFLNANIDRIERLKMLAKGNDEDLEKFNSLVAEEQDRDKAYAEALAKTDTN